MRNATTAVLLALLLMAALPAQAGNGTHGCCECGDCSGLTFCFESIDDAMTCDALCQGAVCSTGVINPGIPCSQVTPCDEIVASSIVAESPALQPLGLALAALAGLGAALARRLRA